MLRAQPGVAQTAVAAGLHGLVAYVVAGPGAVAADELRKVVAQYLPERLVPVAVVELEALPTNGAGKVDRARLPDAGTRRRAARNERDELLCRLFAEILERPAVGIDDEFFSLGGNSLLATRLIGRIRAETGQQVSIRSIFQYPTIAELTARWDDIATASGPRLRRMSRGA